MKLRRRRKYNKIENAPNPERLITQGTTTENKTTKKNQSRQRDNPVFSRNYEALKQNKKMGRKKIQISRIMDERNRQVSEDFLAQGSRKMVKNITNCR